MRSLHIYPKAILNSDQWTFLVKIYDVDTRVNSRFEHVVQAGVTAEMPLVLLKVSWDMVVDDADTDQDVDDALFADDIKGGPQVETVWGNWQALAEGVVAGLTMGYTGEDFWAAWSKQDTAKVRNDARKALVQQRGWTIPTGTIHQHEGDGTSTDE